RWPSARDESPEPPPRPATTASCRDWRKASPRSNSPERTAKPRKSVTFADDVDPIKSFMAMKTGANRSDQDLREVCLQRSLLLQSSLYNLRRAGKEPPNDEAKAAVAGGAGLIPVETDEAVK
ncbi:unnamed protein product, partial [Polarella glacialis]